MRPCTCKLLIINTGSSSRQTININTMINSYENLPVGKFMEIREELKKGYTDDIELQVAIIGILNDMAEDDVLKLKIPDYSKLAGESNFLLEAYHPTAKCPNNINLNNQTYNIIKDVKKLNTAQFIDYNTYMKMDDPDKYLAEVLSIFIVPEGKEYNEGYDITEVHQVIKDYMPISVALNIAFFLHKKSLRLQERTITYLEVMMKMMIWKEKDKVRKGQLTEAERMVKELKEMTLDINGAGSHR